MLLIAAFAIGIVGIRNCDCEMPAMQIDRRNLANWVILLSLLLMSLATRPWSEGSSHREAVCQSYVSAPGYTACWVTTLVMIIDAIVMLAMNPDKLTSLDALIRCFGFSYFWPTAGRVGFGVLIAWENGAGTRRVLAS